MGVATAKSRLKRSTLLGAAALAFAVLYAGPALVQAEWTTEVQLNGWTFVTMGGAYDRAFYSRPARGEPSASYVRLWERVEYKSPESFGMRFVDGMGTPFQGKSLIQLVEYDCAGGRTRILQQTQYADRNMLGLNEIRTPPNPTWAYTAPGTIDDMFVTRACVRTATSPPAVTKKR